MALQGMRELIGASISQSLKSLQDEDRLAAAWPVACGKAMAERAVVLGYEEGILRMEATDDLWLRQLTAMRGQLAGEISRIAGVKVREIHFELKRNNAR